MRLPLQAPAMRHALPWGRRRHDPGRGVSPAQVTFFNNLWAQQPGQRESARIILEAEGGALGWEARNGTAEVIDGWHESQQDPETHMTVWLPTRNQTCHVYRLLVTVGQNGARQVQQTPTSCA